MSDWPTRLRPREGYEVRWAWVTPADDHDPEHIPQVEEFYVETGKAAEHPMAADLLDAPPWEVQTPPHLTGKLLARAPFAPSSPILRLPKQVVAHLKMTRKGRLSFFAQSDGSVIVRRG